MDYDRRRYTIPSYSILATYSTYGPNEESDPRRI